MTYLTIQHIFTTVVLHLRKQGEPAIGTPDRLCQYLNESGQMCAAGCLIKEGLYNQSLEGVSVSNIRIRAVLDASGINMDDFNVSGLIAELQTSHDDTCVHDWLDVQEVRWKALAKRYDLVVPPMQLTTI